MTAQIHILPVIRIEHDDADKTIVVSLSQADFRHLEELAAIWNQRIEQVAGQMLHEMLRGAKHSR